MLKRAGILARFEQAREKADTAAPAHPSSTWTSTSLTRSTSSTGATPGTRCCAAWRHVLASNFKEMGLVGRYAGDEFVILLPDSRAETAFVLAEEVRRAIEDTPWRCAWVSKRPA